MACMRGCALVRGVQQYLVNPPCPRLTNDLTGAIQHSLSCANFCETEYFSTQKQIPMLLKGNIRDATCADDVYQTLEWGNGLRLNAAARTTSLESVEADQFLRKRVPFPSRKDDSGFAEKKVFQFVRRSVSYLYAAMRLTVTRVFISRLHHYSSKKIGRLHKLPRAKRAWLVRIKKEAHKLVEGSAFLSVVHVWPALVDALEAVCRRFIGCYLMEVDRPHRMNTRIMCLLFHLTLVAFKVQLHQLRVGKRITTPKKKGMSPGHRGVLVAKLQDLHGLFVHIISYRSGVSFVVVSYNTRANVTVTSQQEETEVADNSNTGGSDSDVDSDDNDDKESNGE